MYAAGEAESRDKLFSFHNKLLYKYLSFAGRRDDISAYFCLPSPAGASLDNVFHNKTLLIRSELEQYVFRSAVAVF